MSRTEQLRQKGGNDASDTSVTEDEYKVLLAEADGSIYADSEQLMDFLLEARPWSRLASTVAAEASSTTGVTHCSYNTFSAWLENVQTVAQLHHTPGRKTSKFTWLHGEPEMSSLLLSACGDVEGDREVTDALALGEVTFSGNYQTGFRNLCSHAKTVFSCQPDRVFLPTFYLHGSMLEVWVFDRSGWYGSKAIDVIKTPSLLSRLLATFMDNASLGVGDLIKRMILGTTSSVRVGKTIVGDGLTCYRAKACSTGDWKYAVKIKWSELDDKPEARLLQLATEKRVWGVSQLVQHRDVCSTSDWRHGLKLGASRKVDPEDRDIGVVDTMSILGRTKDLGSENATASDPPHVDVADKVLNCVIMTPLGDSLHRFRTIAELLRALRDGIKAHRSLYLDAGILHRDICPGNILIPMQADGSQNSHEADGVLIDLDVARLVTTPSRQFESVGTPLFQAIGVLQCYLPDNPHTYRHDLESFFYTFLFLAICQQPVPTGENQLQLPEASALQMWIQGRPVDRARRKTDDMHAKNFHVILSEFTPEFVGFRSLAEELRGFLFPMKDGELWTGTDESTDGTSMLYNKLIEAIDKSAKLACSL